MSPSQSSQYQPLPAEEKVSENDEQLPQVPVRKQRNNAVIALVVCLIAFASLFAFVGTVKTAEHSRSQQQITEETIEDDPTAYFLEAARATDQQYLLGVGKADITGLVSSNLCME